jgi:hypothetical protein
MLRWKTPYLARWRLRTAPINPAPTIIADMP